MNLKRYKTEFQIAQAEYSRALDSVSDKMNKLASGDLQKALGPKATMADAMKATLDALNEINDDLRKLNELAERRSRALPDLKAWATNKPAIAATPTGVMRSYNTMLMVADKAGDTLTELQLPTQTPQVDLNAGAVDAHLRHRPFQRD